MAFVKFFLWRAEMTNLLKKCGWTWRQSWDYAGQLRDPYFIEDWGPAEALSEDQSYWEA